MAVSKDGNRFVSTYRTARSAVRRRSHFLAVAAAACTLAASHASVNAATYQWDPSFTPATPSGGTGNWDTTSTFWSTGAADTAWVNSTSNIATFGGTAGTVTLTTNITAGTIGFITPGYILSTGANTLTLGSLLNVADSGGTTTIQGVGGLSTASGAAVAINVAANDTLQLNAAYADAGSLTLSSAGTTNITNTFTVVGKSVFQGSGVISISGAASFDSAAGDYVGVQGATLNVMANTTIASPGTGNSLYIGSTGSAASGSTLAVSGGTFSLTSATRIFVGDAYNGTSVAGDGTINIGGGAGAATFTTGTTTNATSFVLGNSVATGTINLNANGYLATQRSFSAGATGKGIMDFNGGTLLATGTGVGIANTITANVRNGGLIVNPNGFAVTLAANFAHSTISGDAATDGGLTVNGTGNATFSGNLSFTGGATFNTASTLNGTNTYSGVTNLNANLDIFSSTALGATGAGNNTIINSGGTLRPRDKSGLAIAEAITLNGGGFTEYNDPGTATYSGVFTLNNSSTIQISPQAQASTVTVFSGGFAEGGSGSTLNIVRNGAAAVASNDIVNITAASTYGGATNISDLLTTNTGIFSVKLSGVNNALPVTTTVTLGGTAAGGAAAGYAQLILGDATTGAVTQSLNGLVVGGTGTKNAVIGGATGASTLTLTPSGTNTYTGAIGGAGTNANNLNLVMGGTGTLALTGAASFTGTTAVNGGTLAVSSALSGTSGVSISSGADLKLIYSSTGTPNTINDSASLAIVYGGSITLALNATTETVAAFLINGVAQPFGIYSNSTAPVGSEADEAYFTSDSSGFLNVAAPEPTGSVLLLVGGLTTLARRRRRGE